MLGTANSSKSSGRSMLKTAWYGTTNAAYTQFTPCQYPGDGIGGIGLNKVLRAIPSSKTP